MLKIIRADVMRTYELMEGGKAKKIVNCLRAPGVQAVVTVRFGQWLLRQPLLLRAIGDPIYFILNGMLKIMWGIEIPRHVTIGPGFYIGHFGGITISPYSRIGSNFSISQQVTIGISGQGEKSGAPIIGDNVYFGAGAKAFGKISIGSNVKIGANAVVHKSIPDRSIVVLDPGYQILPAR